MVTYMDQEQLEEQCEEVTKVWKNSAGKTVENKEYWETLNTLFRFDFKYLHVQWIQGHDINKWNNLVDGLCTNAMLNYESSPSINSQRN